MKFILCLLSLAVVCSASAQSSNTVIHASLKGLRADQWVHYTHFGTTRKDSVKTVAGGFTIHTQIEPGEGTLYWMQIGDGGSSTILYFDKGEHYIKGDDSTLNKITVSGASYDLDYNDHEARIKAAPECRGQDSLFAAARKAYSTKDTVAQQRLLPLFRANDSVHEAIDLAWVKSHPASPFSVILLYQSVRGHVGDSATAVLAATLDTNALHNFVGQSLRQALDIAQKTAIGRPSLDFSQPDSTGAIITLSSFKGRYVLLDFWASWCGPCRAENPNVKANYEKYKDKNFTVLSVSLDSPGARDRWLKAVATDGMVWTQVSDLKGWDNSAAKLYNVKAIPTNLLIDPNGVIVGKNLRGDELGKKLSSLLDN